MTPLPSDWLRIALVFLDHGALWYFIMINLWYLILMIAAALRLRTHLPEIHAESHARTLASELTPSITVLVPAHNEAMTIASSVQALLTLAYPNLEIVVVDDGSTDGTLDVLVSQFDLVGVTMLHHGLLTTEPVRQIYRSARFKQLVVATKANAGKADALNTALDLATSELVCAVDADTIVEPDALQRLIVPFLRSDDVVGAGATIRIVNGCETHHGRVVVQRAPRNPLPGIQAVEYLRAFLFGRLGWHLFGGNLVVSGAFGLFRRDAMVGCGGYMRTVGEDIELVVRMRRMGYERGTANRIEFVPDPVAWTEAPQTPRELGRQRDRWQRGLTDALWRHRRLMCNPRYGVLGLVALPVFFLVEWLGPVVEALGLVTVGTGLVFGAIDVPFALLYFAAAYGLGLMLSTIALLLEELAFFGYGQPSHRAWLLGWALLENLGYRQLTVFWRLRGVFGYLRGRTHWGEMRRRGFSLATSSNG